MAEATKTTPPQKNEQPPASLGEDEEVAGEDFTTHETDIEDGTARVAAKLPDSKKRRRVVKGA